MTPIQGIVGPEMARKTATLGFPEGGYRICRRCDKTQKVSLEKIAEWLQAGIPRCQICSQRTELLTPEEAESIR